MHDIFLHYKYNTCQIYLAYALLSSSKLHGSASADNFIGGIDRRMHAKTPDSFEILSTVQKVGLSMVYNCNRDMVWYVNQHNNLDIAVMHVSSFPEMLIAQSDPVGCSP